MSMFFSLIENKSTAMACLLFVPGITEPPQVVLSRKNGIKVVTGPHKTLQREFPSPKFRPPIELQTNVVYQIPCADCPWSYIGGTGRCFSTRKKEHIRNIKICRIKLALILQLTLGVIITLLTSTMRNEMLIEPTRNSEKIRAPDGIRTHDPP